MGLASDEQAVLEGLLLSDAHLRRSNENCNAQLGFTIKHRSFADAIVCNLPSLSWSPIVERDKYDSRTSNTYHSVTFRSHVDKLLTKEHIRWYPQGTKMVPRDIVLQPLTLLWWYLGDGCLERKKARPNYRRVCLSTDSFSDEELDFLIGQMRPLLGSYVYKECGRIMVSRTSLCRFAELVGAKSPAECYRYKFEFGQYLDSEYFQKSFRTRPLNYINEFRKAHKVRELNYINKELILKKETYHV